MRPWMQGMGLRAILCLGALGALFGAACRPAAAPNAPLAPRLVDGPSVVHQEVYFLPKEQTVLTAVPIWADLRAVGARRVWLVYKLFGESGWVARDLVRMGPGWGGAIPCQEVSTVTGDIQAFLLAFDQRDDVIATTGSTNTPYRTTIRYHIDGEPPHLPYSPPFSPCPDPSDCPPGLPGCPPERDETRSPPREETRNFSCR